MRILFQIILCLMIAVPVGAVDRCGKHLRTVIRESRFYIGQDAPYHLFMGQITQESQCREGVTAFDGGKGLGQFMPKTAEWIHEQEPALQELFENPHPYDAGWSIRALVLYDKWLYARTSCKGWYFAFRSYNGGLTLMNREIARAECCDIPEIEKQCKRKVITLKSGRPLDFCRVNIEYPYLITKHGEKYRAIY